MKISITLNIVLLLVAGLFAAMYFVQKKDHSASQQTKGADDALENIYTRVSVRKYTTQEVEEEKIEKILRAGMSAPTAMNKQPWAMVVVRDTAVLKGINFPGVPAAIVVCGDMERAIEGDGRDFWVQDASAATENMLLATHALGLGATWRGVYPLPHRVQSVKEALNLPENVIPLCIITIGYPDESPAVKDKWKPENVHYDTW